jgi:hypothetical protein
MGREKSGIQGFGRETERKEAACKTKTKIRGLLKWILMALIWRACTRFVWLSIVVASCEHCSEPSGSIK